MHDWIQYVLALSTLLSTVIASMFVGKAKSADRIIDLQSKEIDARKEQGERLEHDMKILRDEKHEIAKTAQFVALENASLKERSDMTPVLNFQKEQSVINLKIIQSLDKILASLQTVTESAKTAADIVVRVAEQTAEIAATVAANAAKKIVSSAEDAAAVLEHSKK